MKYDPIKLDLHNSCTLWGTKNVFASFLPKPPQETKLGIHTVFNEYNHQTICQKPETNYLWTKLMTLTLTLSKHKTANQNSSMIFKHYSSFNFSVSNSAVWDKLKESSSDDQTILNVVWFFGPRFTWSPNYCRRVWADSVRDFRCRCIRDTANTFHQI